MCATGTEEPDPITLSALKHWAYCPRQCGLNHPEQAFDDNLHTQRGQPVHAQADKPGADERQGLRIEPALPVWNDELGLIGKADVSCSACSLTLTNTTAMAVTSVADWA